MADGRHGTGCQDSEVIFHFFRVRVTTKSERTGDRPERWISDNTPERELRSSISVDRAVPPTAIWIVQS